MDRRISAPLPHVLNSTDGEVGRILGSGVSKDVEERETGRAIGCRCDCVFRGDHGHSILALVT